MENNVVYLLFRSDEKWEIGYRKVHILETFLAAFSDPTDAMKYADSMENEVELSDKWIKSYDINHEVSYWCEAWVHIPMRRYFVLKEEVK